MAKKNKKSASESYSKGTDAIIAAAKGGASKQEIREMVVAHNAKNRGKGAKAKISTKNMFSYMPKSTKPKTNKTKAKKEVVAPATLQESRDKFYNEGDFKESGHEGYFKGIKKPSADRLAELSKSSKSGYIRDLRTAVEKKYGESLHEIIDPVDRQMAGDAMIDPKTKEILPMSSASGQYSGSVFPKKAPRGYKMPGWGKRK